MKGFGHAPRPSGEESKNLVKRERQEEATAERAAPTVVHGEAAQSPELLKTARTNPAQKKHYVLARDEEGSYVLPVKLPANQWKPHKANYMGGLPNLFGGNEDENETAAEALGRETQEESDWQYGLHEGSVQELETVKSKDWQGGDVHYAFHTGTVGPTHKTGPERVAAWHKAKGEALLKAEREAQRQGTRAEENPLRREMYLNQYRFKPADLKLDAGFLRGELGKKGLSAQDLADKDAPKEILDGILARVHDHFQRTYKPEHPHDYVDKRGFKGLNYDQWRDSHSMQFLAKQLLKEAVQ